MAFRRFGLDFNSAPAIIWTLAPAAAPAPLSNLPFQHPASAPRARLRADNI